MNKKFKKILKPYYHVIVRLFKWSRRIGLHTKYFSIISNNCTAGYVYQYYGISYKTPTEGVYFTTDDYLKLIGNPKYYFTHKVELIDPEESTLYNPDKPFFFPVGKIDDIEVYFMHYPSPKEALTKWYRRSERINFSKLFCMLTENEFLQSGHIDKFVSVLEHNQCQGICLTLKDYNKKYALYVPNVPLDSGNAAWKPDIIISCVNWKEILNRL